MKRLNTDTAILTALFFAIAPYLLQLPIWIIFWCLFLWGYCFLSGRYIRPGPKKWMRWILTLGGITGVLLTFARHFDSDAYVGLLAIAAGLKPLELHTQRDKVVATFLAYFMIIPSLFYSSTLATALHMCLSVFFTTAVLIHINHPRKHLAANFGLSARIMAQALPLLIILFFLFPRIQGSFFGLTVRSTGLSGFTDHLTLGNISNIARSGKIAFRVKFEGRIPDRKLRYWRGLVFEKFNDMGWTRGKPAVADTETLIGEKPVEYTVTMEPHNKKWLFALDLPIAAPKGAKMLQDRTLILFRSVNQRTLFQMKSSTVYNTGPLRPWHLAARKLPVSGNLKSIALARTWANTPEKTVKKALAYFRENNFLYTLNPPPLGKNSIDDFLFQTRKGYCGHYASAFAFLMRAANIPSRIVGGYLGGELNPFGNYLIVRQSDAHAWVEVWLPDKGWVRVDPTSVVAPERIEQGPAQALPPEERATFLKLPDLGPISRYAKQIRLRWDALNTHWNRRIMGYSYQRQKNLLEKIGIKADSFKGSLKASVLVLGLISLFAGLIFAGFFRKSTTGKDVIQQTYYKFCLKLGRIGFSRRPGQGPLDYATLASSSRKDLQKQIHDITRLYLLLRYSKAGNRMDLKRFRLLVKKFHPKRINQFRLDPTP